MSIATINIYFRTLNNCNNSKFKNNKSNIINNKANTEIIVRRLFILLYMLMVAIQMEMF